MTRFIKKSVLATVLAATALGSVTPAMARPYYGGHRHHNRDNTGAIIAGIGILGVIAAIAATSGKNDRDRYRNRGWEYRDGYYWDRQGRRYNRDGQPYDYRDGYNGQYDDRYDGQYDGQYGYGNGDDGRYDDRYANRDPYRGY
ncbi:MAG: hypothetical protein AB7F98_10490 [Novosphingobium sp.]